MKRVLMLIIAILMLIFMNACTKEAESSKATASTDEGCPRDIKATLSFGTWDADAMKLYDELDIESRFQQLYPNVTLEIEEYKDDTEYFNAMKIRASAKELPDIMFNVNRTLANFAEYLYDLSDLDAAKNNILAEGYAIDGKVLGLPEKRQEEYVLFWRDMFDEAGVEVPQTWDEFIKVSIRLQEYFGKSNPNFMAIALGAKDEWPIYPLVENMPSAISGNGQYWNEMAEKDRPFEKGSDIQVAYEKINDFFHTGVFGKDPLGMGYDQAFSIFTQKNAAMAMDSPMGLTGIYSAGVDTTNLESFYLPFREDASDPLYLPVRGDFLMGITTSTENYDLARAFVEFYFSDAWYPDYIAKLSSASTMSTVEKQLDPVLESANTNSSNVSIYPFYAQGAKLQSLFAATRFDHNKLGAKMFTPDFDLDEALEKLNNDWTAARKSLGYK